MFNVPVYMYKHLCSTEWPFEGPFMFNGVAVWRANPMQL